PGRAESRYHACPEHSDLTAEGSICFARARRRFSSRMYDARRIDGGPPVAKSSAETEAQRQRVNADRSIEYRVMGGGRPAEPWRGHAGGVDESFFWGGASGERAWVT